MPTTRSPLRYPGGKTQLFHYIDYLLKINDISKTYIEPFAGGFGVGLELLNSNSIEKVVLNDLDPSIFSIWNAILNETNEFLALIDKTPVNITEWRRQKEIRTEVKNDPTSIENAFSSFFLNRTNVSGIINGGPIGGQNQLGKYKINCRFNKKRIKNKIKNIASYKNRIILNNFDANIFIQNEINNYSPKDTFIFFDPPYYAQGKNLYLSFVNKNEHKQLAKNILSLKEYKWITTYDIEKEILKLYQPYVRSFIYQLNYSVNKKRKAKEFMFVSNVTKINSYDKVKLEYIK